MRRFRSPNSSEDEPPAQRRALQRGLPLQRGEMFQMDRSHISISSGDSGAQINESHISIISSGNESDLEQSASPVFAPAGDSNYTLPNDTFAFVAPRTSTPRRSDVVINWDDVSWGSGSTNSSEEYPSSYARTSNIIVISGNINESGEYRNTTTLITSAPLRLLIHNSPEQVPPLRRSARIAMRRLQQQPGSSQPDNHRAGHRH